MVGRSGAVIQLLWPPPRGSLSIRAVDSGRAFCVVAVAGTPSGARKVGSA